MNNLHASPMLAKGAYLLLFWLKLSVSSQDLVAYHVNFHEVQGERLGSSAFPLNCELQSPESRLIARRCVILPLSSTSIETIKEAAFHNLAGVLISVPIDHWHNDMVLRFMDLERQLLTNDISIPVYFVLGDEKLVATTSEIVETAHQEAVVTGFSALSSIWSTGYRVVTQNLDSKRSELFQLTNIEGHLNAGNGQKLPIILICAHYDALSSVPAFSYGADSSGSSTVALLELARLFSHLYALPASKPKFEMLFLLTGGGKYNFLGTKRWLDNIVEDFSTLSILDSVAHVICLEGLGSSNFADNLYVHLSRPPKDGSFSSNFIQLLNTAFKLHSKSDSVAEEPNEDSPVQYVHKKINLNQGTLAWEHERFALHRLPGLTLSSWPSVQIANSLRYSSLDGGPLSFVSKHGGKNANRSALYGSVDPSILARNVRVIAEALSRVVFPSNMSSSFATDGSLIPPNWVSEVGVSALLDLLLRRPRSSQLLEHEFDQPINATIPFVTSFSSAPKQSQKSPGLIGTLHHLMSSHLQGVQVSKHAFSVVASESKAKSQQEPTSKKKEDRDAEFTDSPSDSQSTRPSLFAASEYNVVLHAGMEPVQLTVYKLKSSMFDLLIASLVALYLTLWYFGLEYFQFANGLISKLCVQKTKSS